jgi:hypothetical protein
VEPVQENNEDMMTEWTPPAVFWEKVQVGDLVCLERAGWPPLDGFVEDKISSGDIVWVVSGGERRLFHKADGYSLIVRK